MLFAPTDDKVMALAGLVQSGELVSQLATKKQHDTDALQTCALSLLALEADNVGAVFGGAAGLGLGLKKMQNILTGQGGQIIGARERIGYLLSMDQLADRLAKSLSTQAIIGEGLQEIRVKYSALLENDGDHSLILEYDEFYIQLSTLYQNSLSQLGARIIVHGAKGHLNDELSAAKVRTALFAGVRAAYLWHQQGARRWHLFFARRSYVQIAARLLAKVEA